MQTSASEQPRESATHTGCRAGAQQQEHRHYDAESELTQRAANPAQARAARSTTNRNSHKGRDAYLQAPYPKKHTHTHTLVVVQFHSVQVQYVTCTSYPLWGL